MPRSRSAFTAADFRRLALALEGAIERSHMSHPDFRVNGRIFATIHPDDRRGMVKLAPEDQARVVREHPGMFTPENGAWGRQGCTRVEFVATDEETIGEALTLAWQQAMRLPPAAPRRTARATARHPASRRGSRSTRR